MLVSGPSFSCDSPGNSAAASSGLGPADSPGTRSVQPAVRRAWASRVEVSRERTSVRPGLPSAEAGGVSGIASSTAESAGLGSTGVASGSATSVAGACGAIGAASGAGGSATGCGRLAVRSRYDSSHRGCRSGCDGTETACPSFATGVREQQASTIPITTAGKTIPTTAALEHRCMATTGSPCICEQGLWEQSANRGHPLAAYPELERDTRLLPPAVPDQFSRIPRAMWLAQILRQPCDDKPFQ